MILGVFKIIFIWIVVVFILGIVMYVLEGGRGNIFCYIYEVFMVSSNLGDSNSAIGPDYTFVSKSATGLLKVLIVFFGITMVAYFQSLITSHAMGHKLNKHLASQDQDKIIDNCRRIKRQMVVNHNKSSFLESFNFLLFLIEKLLNHEKNQDIYHKINVYKFEYIMVFVLQPVILVFNKNMPKKNDLKTNEKIIKSMLHSLERICYHVNDTHNELFHTSVVENVELTQAVKLTNELKKNLTILA